MSPSEMVQALATTTSGLPNAYTSRRQQGTLVWHAQADYQMWPYHSYRQALPLQTRIRRDLYVVLLLGTPAQDEAAQPYMPCVGQTEHKSHTVPRQIGML